MRNTCGFLVTILAFCGFQSSMSRKQDDDLCTSLCSDFYSDFLGENPKKLHENKILRDTLVKRMCDCRIFGGPDIKRMRRSIDTSSRPRPTTAIGNDTNDADSNPKINTTDNDNKEPPGFSPAKGIKIVNPNALCNYTYYENENSKIKDMKSIDVVFESDGRKSFNVSWVPPEDLDDVSDFLVLWSPQPKSNSLPNVEDNFMRCRAVPKNQTFVVMKDNTGWEYPLSLYLTVITTPAKIYGKLIDLKVFNPITNPMIIPVPPKNVAKDATLQKGSIAGGVVAGIAFIALLFFLLYRKRCRHSESPDNEISATVPMFANNADGLPKILNDSKPKNVDIYFGSYLPESEKYANEVATIASMLRANGYRVVFDQVDSVELNSMGFNLWVEKQILEAKKYIIFCSPGYVKLWQTLATNAQDARLDHINKEDLVRVRYEIKRITDIYSESCSTSKIICIKMDQKMSMKSLPPWMNHNMLLWPEQKYDIIRRLNDQAAMIMDL